MKMGTQPTLKDIRKAHTRIKPFIHRTPVLTCRAIDDMLGATFFFKCENLQKVGAFKIRGACNAVYSLSDTESQNGVAAHSSGNHAAALALAGQWRGIKAFVVMPENSSAVKLKAVAGYGAEIVLCKPTLEAREETLDGVVQSTGAVVIHPYNDTRVICGQGTAALELCEEISDLDIVMAPVGGGGLLSGTAIAVKGLSPQTDVIAGEPERADDAYRSLKAGTIIPVEDPDTIADGLLTSLGDLTFPIINKHVKDILTVSEEEIIAAMRLIWERMKIIVEPSASVPLGAIMRRPNDFSGKRIGIILSGGNVDLDALPWFGQEADYRN
jgi:threonine dehydratase